MMVWQFVPVLVIVAGAAVAFGIGLDRTGRNPAARSRMLRAVAIAVTAFWAALGLIFAGAELFEALDGWAPWFELAYLVVVTAIATACWQWPRAAAGLIGVLAGLAYFWIAASHSGIAPGVFASTAAQAEATLATGVLLLMLCAAGLVAVRRPIVGGVELLAIATGLFVLFAVTGDGSLPAKLAGVGTLLALPTFSGGCFVVAERMRRRARPMLVPARAVAALAGAHTAPPVDTSADALDIRVDVAVPVTPSAPTPTTRR